MNITEILATINEVEHELYNKIDNEKLTDYQLNEYRKSIDLLSLAYNMIANAK